MFAVHLYAMTDTAKVFNDLAGDYEAQRRRLVPVYDPFYGTAVEALRLAGRPLGRVLDLGAGTGLVSRMLAAEYPEVELTLLDGAPAMLEEARSELGTRANYIHADLGDPLPEGPWDAVVSALAIHHLPDLEKASLYMRVHAALMPGGMFVNAEEVSGPTAFFDDAYSAWHQRRATELGAEDVEWHASVQRMLEDRTATVERQLKWLEKAGFADADCLFKDHKFAVLVARRAG